MPERIQAKETIGTWVIDNDHLTRVTSEITSIGHQLLENCDRVNGRQMSLMLSNHPRIEEGKARYAHWIANEQSRKWYQAVPPNVLLSELIDLEEMSPNEMINAMKAIIANNPNRRRIS